MSSCALQDYSWVYPVEQDPLPQVAKHRLLMDVVGYRLADVRGTDEFLHASYDVFRGAGAVLLMMGP